MSSCGFGAAGSKNTKEPIAPWGHKFINGNYQSVPPTFSADNPPTIAPAGGVHCSLHDWSRFIAMILNHYQGKNKTYKKLFETINPNDTYTLGGWIKTSRQWAKGVVFTHSGSNTLNYSVAWLAPNINSAFLGATNAGTEQAYDELDKAIAELIKN